MPKAIDGLASVIDLFGVIFMYNDFIIGVLFCLIIFTLCAIIFFYESDRA